MNRKKKEKIRLLLIGFLSSLLLLGGTSSLSFLLENFLYAQISKPLEQMVILEIPKHVFPDIEINSESALSQKITSYGKQKTLFREDSKKVLPIASLTKLMTALVIIENPETYNFDNVITVSEKAASQDNVPIYSNLKKGESFSIDTLFSLMMIYSSNDAAWALAEVMGPENFVDKMNQKAQKIGLNNTYFVNPTGLDPQGVKHSEKTIHLFNRSTTTDLLNLAEYILSNQPMIFEASMKKGPYETNNGVSSLSSGKLSFIGGKTGYTDEAGGCMVFALKNTKGDKFINIILGATSSITRIIESQKIINYIQNDPSNI
ncbi:MAG: serine hydrolase [Patescibacteria group bacterium]